MAKVLWVEDEQLDNSHNSYPGCMSGIFSVKKHAKCKRRYKRVLDDQDPFDVLKLFDAKTSHILVDHSNRKTLPARKRSLKARVKALITVDNGIEQDQDFVSSPKLQRTYSIHHLETNEWVHPIIFFPENVTESTASSDYSKTHVNVTNITNITNPENDDPRDILEMFEVDKELFVNTLQDRSLSARKSVSRNLMPMKLKDKLNESYNISKAEKTKNSNDDLNGKNITRLRRISSLNESATRFLDFSVCKATLRSSRSLKLTNGSENLLRNDLNQGSRDTYFLRSCSQNERNTVSLSLHKDQYAELTSTQECESLNAYAGEITRETPVLVSEYCPQDEKGQISKGLQENAEKEMKTVNNKKYMKNDDFNYVKKILELSGFIKIGFQQTWYSSNQPLDPFVFQEIESNYFHDPERFADEVNELSHRLLIFDLVDDVLLTMYERSFTYYLKKLSSCCHICSDPTGSRVLDEVWNSVSRMLNFKHDTNESLNDIVSRDLGSDDGWMSLQLDFECVGVDLEDLILDEVLDEIVFELL